MTLSMLDQPVSDVTEHFDGTLDALFYTHLDHHLFKVIYLRGCNL